MWDYIGDYLEAAVEAAKRMFLKHGASPKIRDSFLGGPLVRLILYY